MAAAPAPIIVCPECEKKFRAKADLSGKKIKCPFCSESFVVPIKDEKADKNAPVALAAGDDEDSIDPYGVTTVDLVPRCPNCTQEMGAHEIVCLACGYNTMTRAWGKTTKTIGVTHQRQIVYLLPALGAAAFSLFFILFWLVMYIFLPDWVAGKDWWWTMCATEACNLCVGIPFFFLFWWAGMYCFQKFIEKPIPDEIELK
jgi:DNA-directed RNA polymerase subunit RPC12/RpoP